MKNYKYNTAQCGSHDTVDGSTFVANTMCCACGGGTNVNVDNTASYPWITSVTWASDPTGSSYGKIKVKPTDASIIPAGETQLTQYLRWKISDHRSGQDDGTIYNEFEVNISW